ncbi:glutaredoxin family protein [Chlorobium phaeobacteroides]|jgi:hypothetical protein|uniref:Glutaredoxin 2 n=1 Tax=Chlorobium phaeobacteroides (strain DSM 266 / SMG 266 / 2430) TaxID=290317 RepID=A1BDE7_CHLPD|nr:glutaredoxin family protein [Chlorobium phaeobacteroides]ABL64424.1 glutaredoxin 2 [Chlorobium phaeobacteroides DSM 266]MBV5319809.1 glutaredoxin family protein [Chlorobium phaeobacteroides]
MTESLHTVTIYGAKGCCLCDDALERVLDVQGSVPFLLEKTDISGSPELQQQYGEAIPVVCIDGVEVFRYRVNKTRLLQILRGQGGV